jgi:hypothetical protein
MVVLPANDDDVDATLPMLSPDFQDTIRFIRAVGCRPRDARLMTVECVNVKTVAANSVHGRSGR